MIRQVAKNKLKFVITITSVFFIFLFSYILQINFVIPILIIILTIYLKFLYPDLNTKNYRLFNLAFLFVIAFASCYIIIDRGLPTIYIPFCTLPMLSMILFNELGISLLLTLVIALIIGLFNRYDNFLIGVLFLISGIASILLTRCVRKRSLIIKAGFIVGLIQMFVLFCIDRFKIVQPVRYGVLMLNGIVSSIIVMGILPIFEYFFDTLTDISLLELADFNHPLMQRMMLEAPGTYHHSLVVGNLSEAACQAVGAHALLARIGAYYHDIGKISKPEYFSENASVLETSKHEALSPTMSKIVIMNHVKEGVELAKKYRLKPTLIDFIQQHHGNSLVYYFYLKALGSQEIDEQVKEEGFRYPGPKPKTKETAIVLLADSVEAASRTLKETTPAKIEELVHKVINNKFIDGQLDECDLTLKDLEKISKVFIRILGGIYHSRINYPKGLKSEGSHKKSTKENSYHSLEVESDKKSRS